MRAVLPINGPQSRHGVDRLGERLRVWLDVAPDVTIAALRSLSRKGIGPMVGYLQRFKAAGVVVKSHQEPWLDTPSPVTDLLLAVLIRRAPDTSCAASIPPATTGHRREFPTSTSDETGGGRP